MHELEDAVCPFLGPMISQARATVLTPTMQALLANWAVKTALMLEHLHPTERVIPETEHENFYKTQQPHGRQLVWIAARHELRDSSGREAVAQAFEQILTAIPAPREMADAVRKQWESGSDAYRVTCGIVHVAFQVFGHTFDGKFNIETRPSIESRIWPVEGDVIWPPAEPIDTIGGVEGWHQSFDQ